MGKFTLINLSPDYSVNSSFMDECNFPAYLSSFERFENKSFSVLHSEKVDIVIGFNKIGANHIELCEASFSFPFMDGDVRVLMQVRSEKCYFNFEHSSDGLSWKSLENVQDRELSYENFCK